MRLIRRLLALAALVALVVSGTAAPAAAAVPGAPTIIDWYEDAGEAGILWEAPSNGGRTITSYIIELNTSGQSFELPASDLRIGDYYGAYVYGMINGFTEEFTVRARNADGVGPASAPVQLTPTGCADTPFYDVMPSHPFCDEIAWLFMTGITTGTDTGQEIVFRPGNAVSRQAMAAFLHRFYAEPAPTLTEPFFADVGPSHPFYDAIQWMAESGLSTGTPQAGGKPLYKPGEDVSRQAMAAFLQRAAGEPASTLTEPFFADVGPSHPFYDAIQWMAESGLSTGSPQAGGKPLYKPGDAVSRQAMAAFLQRFDGWLVSATSGGDVGVLRDAESGRAALDSAPSDPGDGPTAPEGHTVPLDTGRLGRLDTAPTG